MKQLSRDQVGIDLTHQQNKARGDTLATLTLGKHIELPAGLRAAIELKRRKEEAEQRIEWNQRRQAEIDAEIAARAEAKRRFWSVRDVLRQHFPFLFADPAIPAPLATGIRETLANALDGEVDPYDLARFLRYWCSRTEYLNAIINSDHRYDINGNAAEPISAEHKADAARRLEERVRRN